MKQLIFIKVFFATTALFIFTINAMSQTSLIYGAITSSSTSYTFSTGDIIYFSASKLSNTNNTCPGSNSDGVPRSNRIQEETNPFILKLVSTSMNSITIYGKAKDVGVTLMISKIEVGTTRTGTYTDVTSSATIVNSMGNNSCGSLTASGLNIPVNSYVKISVTDANLVYKGINISEFYITSQTTAINAPQATEKKMISKKYYYALGNEVNESASGLIIEKQLYDDGSIVTNKVYKRK